MEEGEEYEAKAKNKIRLILQSESLPQAEESILKGNVYCIIRNNSSILVRLNGGSIQDMNSSISTTFMIIKIPTFEAVLHAIEYLSTI